MLEIDDIHTYYGESYVLQGVSLTVKAGTVVALIGRNGMGKTTTLRSILGFSPPRLGQIRFKGENIIGLPSYRIARLGIGLVPQGRHILPSLSVKENLSVAARSRGKKTPWTLDRIYTWFPVLKDRAGIKGTLLSGGEQMMLAIGRALMTNPDLLLLDEPSEGLAPKIIQDVVKIITELKNCGFSIILVEQNLSMALAVADYIYVINKGAIVFGSIPEDFRKNEKVQARYLSVSK